MLRTRFYWSRRRSEILQGYLLLVPAFLFILLIIAYPLGRSLQLSVSHFKLTEGIDSERFCGFCNFQAILADSDLSLYIRNQVIWVIGMAVLPLVTGLFIALLMNRDLRLRGLWRAVFLIPWMMPQVASALSWRWLYDQKFGILNYYLVSLGIIPENIGFLTNRGWLWPSILLVGVWMWFPFYYVVVLGSLQGIPPELYEAGRVDGTNVWTEFWHITLPSIRPVVGVLFILSIIWAMNDFTTIYLLTQGGPGNDSTTMAPLVYKTSIRFYDLGKGAATGVLLMMISMVFALVYVRRTRLED